MGKVTSKIELVELIEKVILKFENESGELINKNTNRENYVKLAKVLSEISKELPFTSEVLQHDIYEEDSQKNLEYPNRRYDITGGQLKDAYFGIVNKPRPYLLDACYIYLTGKGRAANLVNPEFRIGESIQLTRGFQLGYRTLLYLFTISLLICVTLSVILINEFIKDIGEEKTYLPSEAEISALTGIWMYYTGAPQARSNEPNRFRQFVNNLMEVKYRDGKFEFIRHGANINHYGYMTFNSPGVISIHSYVKRKESGEILSPSHSLARLDSIKKQMVAVSATWSFESENRDDIIAIRNIYQKVGDGGSLKEIQNTQQNAACNCKIVAWEFEKKSKLFELRYQHLDQHENEELKANLNEESILLLRPNKDVILRD